MICKPSVFLIKIFILGPEILVSFISTLASYKKQNKRMDMKKKLKVKTATSGSDITIFSIELSQCLLSV